MISGSDDADDEDDVTRGVREAGPAVVCLWKALSLTFRLWCLRLGHPS